jgi:hypothetical protein
VQAPNPAISPRHDAPALAGIANGRVAAVVVIVALITGATTFLVSTARGIVPPWVLRLQAIGRKNTPASNLYPAPDRPVLYNGTVPRREPR